MFRHLFINTLASAGAFFVISIVGFLLIPVLVETYGLKEFGFIVLARLFLPSGVLVLFDFGFSEIATQSVAKARASRAWEEAAREVSILFLLALLSGLGLGIVLGAGAAPVARLFGADDPHFAELLRATGAALPVLFPAAVMEGIVKGYGAFRSLRLIEVLAALLYGLAALALARSGASYASIAYALI